MVRLETSGFGSYEEARRDVIWAKIKAVAARRGANRR